MAAETAMGTAATRFLTHAPPFPFLLPCARHCTVMWSVFESLQIERVLWVESISTRLVSCVLSSHARSFVKLLYPKCWLCAFAGDHTDFDAMVMFRVASSSVPVPRALADTAEW